MNPEEYRAEQSPLEDPMEQPPQHSIHPDTLKFMGMAKDLLESPGIKQSVAVEQQKHEADKDSSTIEQLETEPSQKGIQASQSLQEQPDTLNFRGMARDLLNSPAVKQATEAKHQDQ